MAAPTIVWFRRDLRVADHAPLAEAARRGPVLPLFILDPALLHHPETAPARVAFLLASLRSLDADLRRRGARLVLRRGDPCEVLGRLCAGGHVAGLIAHLDCERIVGRIRDARVTRLMGRLGVPVRWLEPVGATGELLAYPRWREHWLRATGTAPLPAPAELVMAAPSEAAGAGPDPGPEGTVPSLADLRLPGTPVPTPPAGAAAARGLLRDFVRGGAIRSYAWRLSYPAAEATTGLSPHLKFGVITPRQVLHELDAAEPPADAATRRSLVQLRSRLRWGAAMTQRFRYLPQLELRSLWRCFGDGGDGLDEGLYDAWQRGCTGFPIVDAASRCLRAEGGWKSLNFRIRAIHASFLTNLCGIDWRYGALHYMRHLVDGDCPIDHYQWAMQAGVTEVRPQGWSRIYHPGQVAVDRCDPHGLFIRRWLPELADLTNDQLGAPPEMADYPRPILDYESSRRRRIRWLNGCRQAQRGGPSVDLLASMPECPEPFAADRFPAAVIDWCRAPGASLLPAPLDPAGLSAPERRALLSWFQGSRAPVRSPAARSPAARSRRGRSQSHPGQLELFAPPSATP